MSHDEHESAFSLRMFSARSGFRGAAVAEEVLGSVFSVRTCIAARIAALFFIFPDCKVGCSDSGQPVDISRDRVLECANFVSLRKDLVPRRAGRDVT